MRPTTHTIYHLIDPASGSVKYIGKSTNPKARLKAHIAESRERQNTAKKAWINRLLQSGSAPLLIIVASYPDEASARQRESRECHQHRATILNIHDPAKGAADLARQPTPGQPAPTPANNPAPAR